MSFETLKQLFIQSLQYNPVNSLTHNLQKQYFVPQQCKYTVSVYWFNILLTEYGLQFSCIIQLIQPAKLFIMAIHDRSHCTHCGAQINPSKDTVDNGKFCSEQCKSNYWYTREANEREPEEKYYSGYATNLERD